MKYYVFILLCFLYNNVLSQNSLSGKVTHAEEKIPLPFASIFIPDLNLRTLSDTNGNFNFQHLPKGDFLVECKKDEHLTITVSIHIEDATLYFFEMKDEVVEIDEITVTGSSQSSSLKENPLALITFDKNDLLQNTSTNLIDNLCKNPAINQISTGNGISKPVIRGLGYNRIVSLNNGIRQEGQQWGNEHGIEIDEYSVDRVEIIKGPGSLMYGSDALAGVINFLPEYPIPIGQININFISNYQTNNGLQAYSLMNSGNFKGLFWNVRGTYKHAGNYKNAYDGYVMNSGFEEKNINGNLGINKKWGFCQLYASSFNQTTGMTEGIRDSLGNFVTEQLINDTISEVIGLTSEQLQGFQMELPQQKIHHLRVGNSSKFYFNGANLALNFAFQNNKRKEFANVFNTNEPNIYFNLNTGNYDVRLNINEKKGYSFSIGINGMMQNNSNLGKEVLIPEYALLDFGTYVFAKKTINNKLNFAGGIRADWRKISSRELYIDSLGFYHYMPNGTTETKFESLLKTYNAITGSFGFSYTLNEKAAVKFNFARGFRAPTIAELTSNGKHEGALRYEIGNANLKPETSFQTDFGIVFNATHVSTEFALFYNSIQNYIYATKLINSTGNDSIVNPSDPAPTFKFISGNANLFGGEFSIDIHPHPLDWLHIENSFSLVNGALVNQPDSMTNLPFIPPMRYNCELRCEFSKINKFINKPFLSFTAQTFFTQNKVFSAFNTETSTPGYTLLNGSIGMDLIKKNKQTVLSFIFSCNNITNIAYQNHLSRFKYAPQNLATGRIGVFNMGRNLSVKLIIPIDKNLANKKN